MNGGVIFIIILVSSVLIGGGFIKYKLQQFSRSVFGTNSLAQGFENQKRELSNTPKSVSSMTKIYLPLILKDFPNFNFEEFKQKAENMLISALMAISEENSSKLNNASEDLKEQVELEIAQNKACNQKEIYKDITIYDTEITNYKKQKGTCVITLQSAVGYMHYITKDDEIIEGSNEYFEQTKYNIDLIYIQDISKIESDNTTSVGTTCPNCGAPITNLGTMVCEYCHTKVEVINIHVWSINKYIKI